MAAPLIAPCFGFDSAGTTVSWEDLRGWLSDAHPGNAYAHGTDPSALYGQGFLTVKEGHYLGVTFAARDGSTVFQWHFRRAAHTGDAEFLHLKNDGSVAAATYALRLVTTDAGALKVYDSTGTLVHTTATGLLPELENVLIGIEAGIGNASAAVRIWIGQNDAAEDPIVDLTGIDLSGSTGGCDCLKFVSVVGFTGHHTLSGFVGDTAETSLNAYKGLRHWRYVPISGAGSSTQWTPSAGSNYQCVDDDPDANSDGDTTYVASPNSAGADLYATSGSSADLHGVLYVAVQVTGHAAAAGTPGAVQLRMRSSTPAAIDGSTLSWSTSWYMYLYGSATDPDGDAWTKAAVDDLQFGYVSAGEVSPKARISQAILLVLAYPDDYTPPTSLPESDGTLPGEDTGSDRPGYGLVIEGWPDMWVTNSAITGAPDGQTVREGLLSDGITIKDRVIMHEARVEQDGINFKIRPPYFRQRSATQWDDPMTASLSKRVEPYAELTADLDELSYTVPALVGGATLAAGTYWINSEAITVASSSVITARGALSSIAQTHFYPTEAADAQLFVWDYPPTMEGRRAYLYAWGEGFDPTTVGTIVWRGIVRRPPILERDGVTWQIQCAGITDILKQRLAGDIKSAKVVGIYHHSACSIRLRMQYGANNDEPPRMICGWHRDERELLDAINVELAQFISDLGADAFIVSMLLTRDIDDNLRLEVRTGSTDQDTFTMELSSPIIGGMADKIDPWINSTTGAEVDGFDTELATDSSYYVILQRPHDAYFDPNKRSTGTLATPLDVCSPLGYAYTIMRTAPKWSKRPFLRVGGERWSTDDVNDQNNFPPWRVYVSEDFTDVEAVYISGTDKPNGLYTVNNTGSNSYGYFIDLDTWSQPGAWPALGNAAEGFMGFLDGSTEVKPRRYYVTGDTVFTFVQNMKAMASSFGNKGDTPFVTDEDLASWSEGLVTLPSIAVRDFVFYGPVELRAMLQEELKLIGFFMRIDANGKIDVAPLPSLTPTSPVDALHTITADDIITPADNYGQWPTWEPQRDGRITTVKIQQEYDAVADEWVDKPTVVSDGLAVALNKTRGKSIAEIKPYTRRSQKADANVAMSLGDDITPIGMRFLSLFAHDYDVVQLCVSFKKIGILCGDIVSVTNKDIPDGTGLRGVTSRRGVVIEREWPMDPQGDNYGRLTVMLVQKKASGWAPSAYITGKVNTTGNTWTLTCSVANTLNIAWSTNSDGQVLEHFVAGDYIRVVAYDDNSSTQVTGTISGTPNSTAGTCVVVLDAVWTPGAGDWVLEYQEDTTGSLASTTQRQYAYVADSNLHLADGSFARRFQ